MEYTNYALDFALDVQVLVPFADDYEHAIKTAMRDAAKRIDREKSTGRVIAFTDGTTAEFLGDEWKIGVPLPD